MSVPLPTIPGETAKAYKARLAAYKPNSWQIVRQFATYRRVLTMHDGWAEEGSKVDPPVRTFRTAKEAEAYLSRHVGRHFNEFVARVKPCHASEMKPCLRGNGDCPTDCCTNLTQRLVAKGYVK